jgi:Fe-S cluster biogenesis protein NfuA
MTAADSAPSTNDQVRAVLDRIRPAVQADGGDIELVDVAADIVKIRFHGACHGCPSSSMTLHHGIEKVIKDRVPGVQKVVAVD